MFLIAFVFSVIFGITIGVPAILPAENEVITHNCPFVTRSEWGARTPKQKSSLPIPVPYVVIHNSYNIPACYESAHCENAMRCMQDFHMDCRGWWDIGYNFAVGSEGVAYEGRGWDIQGAHALHFNSVSIGICLIGDWTKMNSTLLKTDIITKCKTFNRSNKAKLRAKHLGFVKNEETPVFVSEQLTPRASRLYFLARDLIKSTSFTFCWTAYDSLPPAVQIKAAKSLIAQGVELGFIRPDYKLIGHRQVSDTNCPGATLYQNVKTWDHYASFPATPQDLIHVKELPEYVKSLLRKNTTLLEE